MALLAAVAADDLGHVCTAPSASAQDNERDSVDVPDTSDGVRTAAFSAALAMLAGLSLQALAAVVLCPARLQWGQRAAASAHCGQQRSNNVGARGHVVRLTTISAGSSSAVRVGAM